MVRISVVHALGSSRDTDHMREARIVNLGSLKICVYRHT